MSDATKRQEYKDKQLLNTLVGNLTVMPGAIAVQNFKAGAVCHNFFGDESKKTTNITTKKTTNRTTKKTTNKSRGAPVIVVGKGEIGFKVEG